MGLLVVGWNAACAKRCGPRRHAHARTELDRAGEHALLVVDARAPVEQPVAPVHIVFYAVEALLAGRDVVLAFEEIVHRNADRGPSATAVKASAVRVVWARAAHTRFLLRGETRRTLARHAGLTGRAQVSMGQVLCREVCAASPLRHRCINRHHNIRLELPDWPMRRDPEIVLLAWGLYVRVKLIE